MSLIKKPILFRYLVKQINDVKASSYFAGVYPFSPISTGSIAGLIFPSLPAKKWKTLLNDFDAWDYSRFKINGKNVLELAFEENENSEIIQEINNDNGTSAGGTSAGGTSAGGTSASGTATEQNKVLLYGGLGLAFVGILVALFKK